jgi:hypothetical protein
MQDSSFGEERARVSNRGKNNKDFGASCSTYLDFDCERE